MIKYYKLWRLLDERGMKKKDLYEAVASVTVSKMANGSVITSETIDKLCKFLNVQPGDIMEYVPDK